MDVNSRNPAFAAKTLCTNLIIKLKGFLFLSFNLFISFLIYRYFFFLYIYLQTWISPPGPRCVFFSCSPDVCLVRSRMQLDALFCQPQPVGFLQPRYMCNIVQKQRLEMLEFGPKKIYKNPLKKPTNSKFSDLTPFSVQK